MSPDKYWGSQSSFVDSADKTDKDMPAEKGCCARENESSRSN